MIAILGISHKTAEIEIRENFSISKEEIPAIGEYILQQTEITELVILSTCNRTEIYFYHEKNCHNKTVKELKTILKQSKKIEKDYSDAFYFLKKEEAVNHLFRVISGMDSMVLGEDQIVNQVKEAYTLSTQHAFADAVLMRLFQKAFETSKTVRSKTGIQHGATSVSYVAADMYSKMFPSIDDKKILLIGTGETGKIALSHLKKKGASKFILTNRTFDVAKSLADQFGGRAIPFEDFHQYLPESDAVITATNARSQIINRSDINRYYQPGKTKQHFFDLSVPRNIDQDIRHISDINLIGVDDLNSVVNGNTQKRLDSISKAENIINQMVNEYYEWLDNRTLRPLIKTISKSMNAMHIKEIQNSIQCYGEKEIKIMEEYGNRLAQKYINAFIKNLKNNDGIGHDASIMARLTEIFDFGNKDLT